MIFLLLSPNSIDMRLILFSYFFLLSLSAHGQFVTAVYDDCCPLPRVINVDGGAGDGYVSNATFVGSLLTLILNNGNPPITVTILPDAESGTYVNGTTDRVRLGTLPFLEDVWLYTDVIWDFKVHKGQTNPVLGQYFLVVDDSSFVFQGSTSWRAGAYWEQYESQIIAPVVTPEHVFVGVEGEIGKKLHGVMRAMDPITLSTWREFSIEVDKDAAWVYIKSLGDNLLNDSGNQSLWSTSRVRHLISSAGTYEVYSAVGGLKYFEVDGSNGHNAIPYTASIGIDQVPPAGYSTIIEDDLYMITTDNAIVMKSPDGNCWELRINNAGTVTTTNIICP